MKRHSSPTDTTATVVNIAGVADARKAQGWGALVHTVRVALTSGADASVDVCSQVKYTLHIHREERTNAVGTSEAGWPLISRVAGAVEVIVAVRGTLWRACCNRATRCRCAVVAICGAVRDHDDAFSMSQTYAARAVQTSVTCPANVLLALATVASRQIQVVYAVGAIAAWTRDALEHACWADSVEGSAQ